LNLHDNLSVRAFSDVEKGMILDRLMPWIKKDEIIEHYMPLVGLPSHVPTLQFYLRLEQELGPLTKSLMARGRLALKAAKLLLDMDYPSRSSVVGLISNIKLNVNQQIQLIEHISDLSHIEHKSIGDILGESSVEKIRSNTRMNEPQKGRAILRAIRVRRYPSLSSAETTFRKRLSRLRLGDRVRIDYPPGFEAPHYRLQVLFKNGRALREELADLLSQDIETITDPWQ